MTKYNFDKSILKGLSIKPFMDQVKVRNEHIDKGSVEAPVSIFGANKVAKAIHPEYVEARIVKKVVMPVGGMYIIAAAKDRGFDELPPFRAGQHITVELDMPDKFTRRNYCITSAPSAAKGEHGFYQLIVSNHGPGHASEFILNNWKEGDIIRFTGPSSEVYYDPIKDSHDVLAIGIGGPCMSLCYDIVEGNVDINLTALAIIPVPQGLAITDTYKELGEKTGGKIKAVPVLLNGEVKGVEKGPINSELLRRVMTDQNTGKMKDMTIILTCPDPFCSMIEAELNKLGISERRIRKEPQGNETPIFANPAYPAERVTKQFNLKVWVRGECTTLTCSTDKTIADAVEGAKIKLKTSCRSGHCGMCHTRLISGEYFMPENFDGRRYADKKFGWIHPCCTYPLSDMEIEVFPETK